MPTLSTSISVRFTPEQMQIIKEKAEQCHIPIREFIRSTVIGYEIKSVNVALSETDRKVLYDFEEHVMPTLTRYNNALNATLLGISEQERKKILLGKHNMKEWAEAVDVAMSYVHKYKDYLETIYNI